MRERKGNDAPGDRTDVMRTYWPELRGRVQEQWSRLTDDWLGEVDGRHDRLAEKLREAYGVSEAEANRQVDDFIDMHWNAISARAASPSGRNTGGQATSGSTATNDNKRG